MDYFFWDDVFGCRDQVAKELIGPSEPDAEVPEPQGIAVVITWVDPDRRRYPSPF